MLLADTTQSIKKLENTVAEMNATIDNLQERVADLELHIEYMLHNIKRRGNLEI